MWGKYSWLCLRKRDDAVVVVQGKTARILSFLHAKTSSSVRPGKRASEAHSEPRKPTSGLPGRDAHALQTEGMPLALANSSDIAPDSTRSRHAGGNEAKKEERRCP